MLKFAFICIALLVIGCRQPVRINGHTLTDTLEILKKKADFRPLDSVEVYNFLNNYYLPRLDTMPAKRKIFLYALNGRNFQRLFKYNRDGLIKRYSGDTTIYVPPKDPTASPYLSFTKTTWDSTKLSATKIITDTSMYHKGTMLNYKLWHQKYGYGYMCISYPQFNANTKRLMLREWVENYSDCGTGREETLYFTKINGGWLAD